MDVEHIRARASSQAEDPCTRSNYRQYDVAHTALDLKVFFGEKKVAGSVRYDLKKAASTRELVLDTSFLSISGVSVDGKDAKYELESRLEPFGAPLVINVPDGERVSVRISFSTTSGCTALQFIEKATTDSKVSDYLFSQCQAIHARSLFPCFDTPAVKSPYSFTVESPSYTLMSGRPSPSVEPNVYRFEQPIPIPSYLVAIASGNLAGAPIGPRSTVYTEPPNLKACQWEFEKDMENFLHVAEALIYKYEWLRYDALILPLSFPYGGMENPNITFATPTLISGDRSQVQVMGHELAHSWSGNLVTNCTWEHFWLNEGWTVYLERRILGGVASYEARKQGHEDYVDAGEKVRHFAAILGWNDLVDTVKSMPPKFTSLVWDLQTDTPDDAFSKIPYEKGFSFLFYLETLLGGVDVFDPFMRHYFGKYRYKSLDSFQFIDTLYAFFEPQGKKDVLDSVDWNTWLYGKGMPPFSPKFDTRLADECYALSKKWLDFELNAGSFGPADIEHFEPNQHLLFMQILADKFSSLRPPQKVYDELQSLYPQYSLATNCEIIASWNDLLLKSGSFSPLDDIVKKFAEWLGTVGRMKFARPGYKLLKDHVDAGFAVETFRKFESRYHPICKTMVKKDLGLK